MPQFYNLQSRHVENLMGLLQEQSGLACIECFQQCLASGRQWLFLFLLVEGQLTNDKVFLCDMRKSTKQGKVCSQKEQEVWECWRQISCIMNPSISMTFRVIGRAQPIQSVQLWKAVLWVLHLQILGAPFYAELWVQGHTRGNTQCMSVLGMETCHGTRVHEPFPSRKANISGIVHKK